MVRLPLLLCALVSVDVFAMLCPGNENKLSMWRFNERTSWKPDGAFCLDVAKPKKHGESCCKMPCTDCKDQVNTTMCFNASSNRVTITDNKGSYTTSVVKYGEIKQEPAGVIHHMVARFSTNGFPHGFNSIGVPNPIHEFHVREFRSTYDSQSTLYYKVCATANFSGSTMPGFPHDVEQGCCNATSSNEFSCQAQFFDGSVAFTLTKPTLSQMMGEFGYAHIPTNLMSLRAETRAYSGTPNLPPVIEKLVDVTSGQPIYLEQKGGPYIDEAIVIDWCAEDTTHVLV